MICKICGNEVSESNVKCNVCNADLTNQEDDCTELVKEKNKELAGSFMEKVKEAFEYVKTETINLFKIVINIIKRPVSFVKEEANKDLDNKKVITFLAISSIAYGALNLITRLLTCGIHKELNWFNGSTDYSVDYSIISDLNYLDLIIFKPLSIFISLAFLGLVVVLIAKVFKKNAEVSKSIYVVTLTMLPILLLFALLTHFVALTTLFISLLFTTLIAIISIVVFYNNIDIIISDEDEDKALMMKLSVISVVTITVFIYEYYMVLDTTLKGFLN